MEHFDTIVIGAGMSGLSCARRLFQHEKWRQPGRLCVLEARDRIGGRIESVHVRGCRLDTGANWIHGVGTAHDPNPLMEILPKKRARPLSGSVVFRPSGAETLCTKLERSEIDSEGWVAVSTSATHPPSPTGSSKELVIPSDAAGKLTAAMWTTIGSLHELAHGASDGDAKNTTMLKAISQSPTFRDAFASVDPEYHSALRAMPQFVESMEAAPLAAVSAEHDQDTPGMSLLEFKIDDFDGDQVFLQDGYAEVAAEVAKELIEHGLVRCGADVKQIDWSSRPIHVKTSAGEYTANDVVCTIPLGVLKKRKTGLFQPKLPKSSLEAIDSLGFGTLDKVFLVYSHPWWTEEPYTSIIKKGITRSPVTAEDPASADKHSKDEPDFFIGFTDALPGIEINKDGTVSAGVRNLSLTNLHSLTGFPVLSCFTSCANAKYIEGLSDSKAGDFLHRELTLWFGQEPPRPEAVHVTRWASDPYSLGSYTHMITGLSERRHREEFQKSLSSGKGSSLRFAGEHTSSDHFATVHGALISGRDAANGLIKKHSAGD